MTLERDLGALAAGFPDPPDLTARVATGVRLASSRRRRRRVAVLALALVLLVPATALAVSSDLRNRVLDSFGLRDVKIITVTRLPEAGPEVRPLQLGTRISAARARKIIGAGSGAPGILGAPDGIFEQPLSTGVDVTWSYDASTIADRLGPRRRVLVSFVRGTIFKTILGKSVPSATKTIRFEIDGQPALLLTGHPHLLLQLYGAGGLEQTFTRFAGTTLLWQRPALLIRIEANLPRSVLIRIARSIPTR